MLNPTTEIGNSRGTRRRKQSKPNRIGEEDDGILSDSSNASSSTTTSTSSPFKKFKASSVAESPATGTSTTPLLHSTINNLINLPLLYDLLRQEQSTNPNINIILQQQLLLFKQYHDRLDDVSPTLEEVNESPKASIDEAGHKPPTTPSPSPPPRLNTPLPIPPSNSATATTADSPPQLDVNLDPYRPLSPKLNEIKESTINSLDLLTKRTQEVLNSQLLEINLSSIEKKTVKESNSTFFKHRCRYCGKVFGSDSALQIHIRSHTGERPFKCNICGSRFTTKGNLKVHFSRHSLKFPHIKMNPHPIPESLDALHPPLYPDDVDDVKPWKLVGVAERIERRTPDESIVRVEEENAESPIVPEDLSIKDKIIKEEVSEDNDTWSEKSDDYDVMSSKSLPEQKSNSCIVKPRPQRPSSTSTYPQHKQSLIPPTASRSVSPPPNAMHPAVINHLLPRPGSNDNSWESLIEITHASETSKLQQLVDNIEYKLIDPNQCIICHRVLSCKSALQMHYRTHTGERPFRCRICSRSFTTKGNLKTHMSVHRIKPSLRVYHQCPVCHKRFANGLILQQHIRLHTGEETDLSLDEIRAGEVSDGSSGGPTLPLNLPVNFAPPTFFPMMSMQPIMALEKHVNTIDEPTPLDLTDKKSRSHHHHHHHGSSKQNAVVSPSKSESLWISPPVSSFQPNILLPPPPQILVGPPSFQRSTTCNICLKTFACNSALEIHYRSHTKERPFICNFSTCQRGFSTKGNMKQHMLTHKTASTATSPRSTIGEGEDTDDENSKMSNVSETPSSIVSEAMTRREVTKQHESGVLEAEMMTTRKEEVMQPVPPAEPFPVPNNVPPRHQTPPRLPPPNQPSSSGPESKYLCKVCHKNFSSNSSVHIHMRTHTGDKPFKCTVCGKAFTTKGNLKVHLGTHTWTPSYNHRRGRRMSLELSSLGGFIYYDGSNPAGTKTNQ